MLKQFALLLAECQFLHTLSIYTLAGPLLGPLPGPLPGPSRWLFQITTIRVRIIVMASFLRNLSFTALGVSLSSCNFSGKIQWATLASEDSETDNDTSSESSALVTPS